MTLTTDRFVLSPLTPDAAPALHQLWTTPGVRRFLWDGEIIPMARTVEAIEYSAELFRQRGAGLWGAWSRVGAEALVGFGGLWPFRDPPEFELLYGVGEPLWGQGYAPEIGRAIADYCFEILGMTSVGASTDVENVASVKVLEKIGFQFVHRRTADGLDTVFYERRKSSAR